MSKYEPLKRSLKDGKQISTVQILCFISFVITMFFLADRLYAGEETGQVPDGSLDYQCWQTYFENIAIGF